MMTLLVPVVAILLIGLMMGYSENGIDQTMFLVAICVAMAIMISHNVLPTGVMALIALVYAGLLYSIVRPSGVAA